MVKKHRQLSAAREYRLAPVAAAISLALSSGPAAAQIEPGSDSGSTNVIEELVVKGFRGSLGQSLATKRNASSVIDSIAAEDIGKFPDQNVAEALQRITGVSISRTNGEGSQVTVRGFGPEFNEVRVNNRLMATTTGGRDFDFQLLPSELITGADVVKAPTAGMPEGSIGALVNLRTIRPLSSPGLNSTVALRARYNDLAEESTPEITGIFSNTFAGNTIGAAVGFTYSESENRIDLTGGVRSSVFDGSGGDVNGDPILDESGNPVQVTTLRFPGRQEFRVEQEERERLGITAAFDWEPSDNVTHTVDLLYSDFSRQGAGFGIQAPLQSGKFSNVVASAKNTVLTGTTTPQRFDVLQIDQGTDSETYLVGFNSQAQFNDFLLTGDLSHSKSDTTTNRSDLVPQIGSGNGTDDLGTISFDGRNSDVLGVTTTIDVANPANIRAHWNALQRDEIEDEVTELRLSGLKELTFDTLESVEAGVFYTDRTLINDHFETDGNLNCVVTCGTGLDLPDNLFSVLPFDNYLSDERGNFPRRFVVISDIQGYFDAINQLKGVDAFTPVLSPRASSRVDESTVGAYLQLNFEGGEIGDMTWSGNVGLRYASTHVSSSGFSQSIVAVRRNDPDNPNATALLVNFSDTNAVTKVNRYSNLLPSANFKLDINDKLLLRVAAAQTITRPAVNALGVAESFQTSNIENFGVVSGNPSLTPYEVTQWDVSLEYYADNGSGYSFAVYGRDIDTFIDEATILEDSGFMLESNFGPPIPLQWARTSQRNRDGGRITGVEAAATVFFDFLPGWASGFGAQANYTYADAKDNGAPVNELPAVTPTNFGVEGFAENSFNVTGFYDKDDLQVRLAYNWRDDFLLSRRGARSFGLPEVVDSFGQLDMSASYQVTDTWAVTFEGINLTDERVFVSEDIKERVSLIAYSGRRFVIGVRGTF